jgi:hypothetical protein
MFIFVYNKKCRPGSAGRLLIAKNRLSPTGDIFTCGDKFSDIREGFAHNEKHDA